MSASLEDTTVSFELKGKGRITVETLRSHCHTYQVYVNDTWATSIDNNSPASTEESKDILLFPLSACHCSCETFCSLCACQRIFVFDFHTVLHPLLVSDAPKPLCAFWGVWIWTQNAFSLIQTTAEIVVDSIVSWQNRKQYTSPFPSSLMQELEKLMHTQIVLRLLLGVHVASCMAWVCAQILPCNVKHVWPSVVTSSPQLQSQVAGFGSRHLAFWILPSMDANVAYNTCLTEAWTLYYHTIVLITGNIHLYILNLPYFGLLAERLKLLWQKQHKSGCLTTYFSLEFWLERHEFTDLT